MRQLGRAFQSVSRSNGGSEIVMIVKFSRLGRVQWACAAAAFTRLTGAVPWF